jgi:hypothetical protein
MNERDQKLSSNLQFFFFLKFLPTSKLVVPVKGRDGICAVHSSVHDKNDLLLAHEAFIPLH